MKMESFEKGSYMHDLLCDYWTLCTELFGMDEKWLLDDNFWPYAEQKTDAFYKKYKTPYALSLALGIMNELESRYKKTKQIFSQKMPWEVQESAMQATS